jgi:molybdenum cofactor biosynthesis protein MoaC
MTDALFPPLSPSSGVHLADIASKGATSRTAVAAGRVEVGAEAARLIAEGSVRKGDVFSVAQIAGILGAKQTSRLIPLCHDVQVKGVEVTLELDEEADAVDVRAFVKTVGETGVEMEALTAVSIASLTVYDMCKSINKEIEISSIRLLAKTGGQSGDYLRPARESD